MKILFTILLGFALTTSAFAANDDESLKQAEAWFAGLNTAQSKFQQIDYQGNVMRGQFYIDRPGRLRFQYDAPTKDFIVADGVQIHFYDGEADQYNSAPIGMTLADFILRDDLSFMDEKINVESVVKDKDMVNITITQADEPGMGELILKFTSQPFALKSWDIIDAQGLKTSIVLNNLNRNTKIPASLFKVDNRNLNE